MSLLDPAAPVTGAAAPGARSRAGASIACETRADGLTCSAGTVVHLVVVAVVLVLPEPARARRRPLFVLH
jgi:hypothetical protein